MEYKDRIKAARKHAKLTQAELAQKVGITQVSISDLERGKSVSSSFNASIAKACKVNALWLETEEGPMLPVPLSEAFINTDLGGFDPADSHLAELSKGAQAHPARGYQQDDLYESAPLEQRADVDEVAEKMLKLSPEQARKLKLAMDLLIPDDGSAKD